MYDTILVATDGSDVANRATDRAIDLASTFDAELHVVFVVDTRRYGSSMLSESDDVVDDVERRGQEILSDVETRAAVAVTGAVRRGRPHDEIGAYADAIDADLIVLGNRGLGKGGKIGSTAERVVRYVDRPVMTA
ncbi:universal stress protein [Natronobacterium gregoryi]|uniref:Universal stress protein n=2 Tax=Natronobacterium gregoryi TaxID=44930 RepID=L0AFM0_NATGS|nr:universal stress protein [Natronobacterium gregoryi]AFZ71947.1 universal stress protein UspA-like protein [Natronobacterium gregoryi SP2]ELY62558.1 UspA domain-containing protein [Natronobacterium gregoryi SP2]PLK20724.1 universal stress protein [Natronobacterium gregoryi SP2]SFJ13119.1 Nucleotide-binding universal stress protein, UspA family [Natronobacterium gregoryi]